MRILIVTLKIDIVTGIDGPEAIPGGGTSLHDISGWFPNHEFWIPEGTEYCGELVLRKDAKEKTSPFNPQLRGHHFQIEVRTRLTVLALKGMLNNFARAAVARQCELARVESK